MKTCARSFTLIVGLILIINPVIFAQEAKERNIKEGKFQPAWESFEQNYVCPDWFRDVKFGIWAHWSAQCVPEEGDWYARHMYIQGWDQYNHHIKKYGHPSQFGFMEFNNLWKAEKWYPEKLMELYKRAGAKYFVTLANHHDNFDNYDSQYHDWNSLNVGPGRDIVGTWKKIAKKNGLYFGVSNHSAHSWHWFQTAYGYDGEGPLAGVRYDAATLTKEDGKGKWWEGLDPQDLYTGPTIKMPDGITTAREVAEWHEKNTRPWTEEPPENNPGFTENWFLRCQDLIDKYQPDLVYFDNTGLPLGQAGLDIVAHYYNSSMEWNNGKVDVVATAKRLTGNQNAGVVEDYERGFTGEIKKYPWQTCTCIGEWHYNRNIYNKNSYKSVKQVIHQLIDIVSKNGNLLLSIPLRGDGSIDELEVSFLEGMAEWMETNEEAIYGTRPWKIFGEGPTQVKAGMFNENKTKFTPDDIRFTQKDSILYAFIMGWPGNEYVKIESLASVSEYLGINKITDINLLGYNGILNWTQDEKGLSIKLPGDKPCQHAIVFKINFSN
ncbi:MAG: alpha-L-fucosidase [Bacteroidales bacterium]|nr:MAG: alpha-L-fucosidase [Bacteroidales bacterium]